MSQPSPPSSLRPARGWGSDAAHETAPWPLRLTDLGLALLIVALPFIWGGRQAIGNFATVILAGWTAFWWAIHQLREPRPRIRFSGAEPLLFMAVALVVVQTLALPEAMRDRLSPHIASLLPGWTVNSEASLGLGTWPTLSFAPWQTSRDLVTLVSLMAVFFVGVQRIETIRDIQRLIRCVAASGCLMGLFGLAQYFTSNGLFFWFYEHPDTTTLTSAKGAFTNANHFASYLAMTLPAQLWWFITDSRQIRKERHAHQSRGLALTGLRAMLIEWGPVAAMGLTIGALLLSQSRGGLLVATVGMAVACGLFWKQGLLDTRGMVLLVGIGVMGMLVVMAFGQRLERELVANAEALRSGEAAAIDNAGSRQKIWATDLKVVQDFPLVGTGLGTHAFIYPSYHDFPDEHVEFTHAENGYLQVALETGVTGLAIAGLLIALVGYWCLRGLWIATSAETKSALVVVVAGLVVNLVHSCTDFVWYVPSCMAVVMLFAASASGLYRLALPALPKSNTDRPEFGRLAWGILLILVVTGVGWGTRMKWPEVAAESHYHEFRRISKLAPTSSDSQQFIPQRHAHIMRAVAANPHDPVLMAYAARSYRLMFLLAHAKSHEMRFDEIQQAAIASNYATKKELHAWLDIPEVVGPENRQQLHRAQLLAIRSLRLCPLPAQPYIDVAQLAWLNQAPPKIADRYYQQALTAQPYNGVALTRYGDSLHDAGNIDQALKCYHQAYVRNDRCRAEIIRKLSRVYPVDRFLEHFPMDRESLTAMRGAYHHSEDVEGYHRILRMLAKAEMAASLQTSGETAAAHVVTAHGCYHEAGDSHMALEVLQKSADRHGNSLTLRYNLGSFLLTQGEYEAALPHLEWCHRRKPDDATIKQRVSIAIDGRERRTNVAEEPDDARVR